MSWGRVVSVPLSGPYLAYLLASGVPALVRSDAWHWFVPRVNGRTYFWILN